MKKKGFTLLELLIVIAIIAILASAIAFSIVGSLQKGRDARRKSDLNGIQKALELYYADNNAYPAGIPAAGQCWYAGGGADSCPANVTIYMNKIPADPTPNSTYTFCSDTKSYQLYAKLESSSDSQIIPSPDYSLCSGAPSCVTSSPGEGPSSSTCFGLSSSNISP